MRTPLFLAIAAAFVIGSSVGPAQADPVQPGAKPGAQSVRLPLELQNGKTLTFQLKTLSPSTEPMGGMHGSSEQGGKSEPGAAPGSQPAGTDPDRTPAQSAARSQTFDWQIKIRDSGMGRKLLDVSVRSSKAGPSALPGAGAMPGMNMPGMNGLPHRSFTVQVDDRGNIQDTQNGKPISATDRSRLALILGSGLHGMNLDPMKTYRVGGLSLRLDQKATGTGHDVTFEIVSGAGLPNPAAHEADPAHPGSTASATSTGRVVYDGQDGLVKSLTPTASTTPCPGRFEIWRETELPVTRANG